MGRKKLWTNRLTLPLDAKTISKMDSSLATDEARVDLIRVAIDRELRRRKMIRQSAKFTSSLQG